MRIRQYEIWVADLNPRVGTEPEKTRPVLVVQTDLLNEAGHPSTLVCPLTTKVRPQATILRVHLTHGTANLRSDCDVMIDQMRAIDNQRLINRIGRLPAEIIEKVRGNISVVLDLT